MEINYNTLILYNNKVFEIPSYNDLSFFFGGKKIISITNDAIAQKMDLNYYLGGYNLGKGIEIVSWYLY